jgi:hypothetical protein
MAVTAQIAITQIIGHDDDYVGRPLGRRSDCNDAQKQKPTDAHYWR